MKKYLYILLSAVLAVAIIGCSDSGQEEPAPDPIPPNPAPIPGQEPRETPYYITDYLIVNSLTAAGRYGWNDPEGIIGYDSFPFQGHVIEVGCRCDAVTEESDSELFAYFQELYGDVHYTGETRPHENKVFAYPFERITMICHEDFDAEHPAGSAVDDIVKMHIATFETFITNGYVYPEGWEHRRYYSDWGVMPVGEFYLHEINSETARLISPYGMVMKFMKEPDMAGEYPFTLTITMNGKAVSHTFKLTFGDTPTEE